MNKEQAIDVLVQVANLAQSRGVLSLKDAGIVIAAVQLLRPEKSEETSGKTKKENKETGK